MRNLFALFILIFAISCSQNSNTEEKTANNEEAVASELYGEALSPATLVGLETLQATLDESEKFEGKVKVEIEDVCQMKGCWMTAKLPDGRSMRITFKDYGFFVPKNSSGLTAIIEGEALKKITDEATLKHYAEESGKSSDEIAEINGPGEELSFVASGVVIESED